ncbi:Uncharacterized protein Adt_09486 [Abeliophyllum distichum]|uniref:Uncharacterized protein n=1 Tax=Abeliophyllum distichum TaxID=126358 RepID=A0ABD1UHF4_9LAMI
MERVSSCRIPLATTRPYGTPLSAVAPARYLLVSRLQRHISLETIYEEIANNKLVESSETGHYPSIPQHIHECFIFFHHFSLRVFWKLCKQSLGRLTVIRAT